MKTIEYRTVNKASWPHGPWFTEPDKKQWLDETTSLPCLIVRGPAGALCGYVGVPSTHPAYRKDYSDINVRVHGGLTFAAHCSPGDETKAVCHRVEPGEDDNVWWLGFDCAHDGDLSPIHSSIGGHYRDFSYVETEVRQLAKQLAELKE